MVAPDLVVVSPHLDDAVLSLGGLIGREVAAGRRVEVWSCFTSGPPLDEIAPAQRVFGDYSIRRAEDTRALAILGAQHRWLDHRERIWRKPPLDKTLHVFHTPPHETDFAELPALRRTLGELLATGALVYAPLGVGHHTDHVEVALAVVREAIARGALGRVRFYEDPYALGGACRRRHFVTRRARWRWFGAPGWASPRVAALLRVVAWSAHGPDLDDYAPELARMSWTCTRAALDDADESRKLAAIAEYASQVTAFGGIERVRAFVKRAHRSLGGEPVWTASPAAGP